MNRLEEMREQVFAFHKKHPEVWNLFVQFTKEKAEKGFTNYSARGIFHRIRWETDKPDYQEGCEFKLNDHHSPFYARAFMKKFPEHEGFFRTRKQTSEDKEATYMPEMSPQDYEYEGEDARDDQEKKPLSYEEIRNQTTEEWLADYDSSES